MPRVKSYLDGEEAYECCKRWGAVMPDEMVNAVARTHIGDILPVLDTHYDEGSGVRGYNKRKPVIRMSEVCYIGPRVIIFSNGLSCQTKELALYYRNPKSNRAVNTVFH